MVTELLPETRRALEDAGYVYESDGFCSGCDEPVQFWYNSTGLRTPISVLEIRDHTSGAVQERSINHFAICRLARKIRNESRKK